MKYTTVFAGARKNDFTPHEPLSDGARDVLASEVDRLYGMFVDAVARRRSANVQAVRGTEAGILYGEDSVARGFADRVGTFREALAEMTALVSKPKFAKGGTIVSEATQAATSPPVPDLAAIEAEARQQGYAEAAEIVALCNIAGRPALAGDFIARHTRPRRRPQATSHLAGRGRSGRDPVARSARGLDRGQSQSGRKPGRQSLRGAGGRPERSQVTHAGSNRKQLPRGRAQV